MITLLFAAAVATNLPPITVEASRIDAAVSRTPQSVRVWNQEEIRESGTADIVQFLEKVVPSANIHHLGGANPALAQVSLGGFGENGHGRTLILVDGEKLNDPDMAAPNLGAINLATVKKLEILTGPQTVLHGDNAVGGVINIITDSASTNREGHVELHGGSWGSVGGAFSYADSLADEGLRYRAAAGYDHSDGYRSNSGHDLWTASGSLRKDWTNSSWLRVGTFYHDTRYELPDGLTRTQWQESPTLSHAIPGNYSRRRAQGYSATLNAQITEDNVFRLAGRFSERRTKSRQDSSWGPYGLEYDLYSYELTPQWINTTPLAGFDNTFTLGGTYRFEQNRAVSTYARGRLTRQVGGAFAQDTFDLIEDTLSLQLGARLERFWFSDTGYNGRASRKTDEAAYEAAILWTPLESVKSYVRGTRFYHAPFIDEFSYASNGLLSPETGWRVDVGGDWEPLDWANFRANGFLSRIDDELFYNPIFYSNMNSPYQTRRAGIELGGRFGVVGAAVVDVGYSLVEAEVNEGPLKGKDVPAVPKQTLSLTGRYWLVCGFSLFGGYRYQTAQWAVSDWGNMGGFAGSQKAGRIPAYGLFHIGIEWEGQEETWLEGWHASVTIDNLFDKN